MLNAVQAMDAGGCLRANTRLEADVVVEIQDEPGRFVRSRSGRIANELPTEVPDRATVRRSAAPSAPRRMRRDWMRAENSMPLPSARSAYAPDVATPEVCGYSPLRPRTRGEASTEEVVQEWDTSTVARS